VAPLKRRQFGQLAAASLTSTVVAGLSSKALAQKSEPSREILYGVNLLSASNAQNREDQTPSVELNVAELATGRILSKANVPVLSVNNLSPTPKTPRAFFLPDYDRITKVIVLGDGTIVISTVSSTRNGHFNHFISTVGLTSTVESVTNAKFTAQKVLGFERSSQTVESLLSLPKNQLLSLVGSEGIPPFERSISAQVKFFLAMSWPYPHCRSPVDSLTYAKIRREIFSQPRSAQKGSPF
jgi:hypothetical protein